MGLIGLIGFMGLIGFNRLHVRCVRTLVRVSS